MARSEYIVAEEKASGVLTLIVDKKDIFGSSIAKKIHGGGTTVLVTAKEISSDTIVTIPFTKTIPEIPDGNYVYMFFVWDGKADTLHLLEPLLQKATADKAQFIFITDYHCYTEKLARFIHQEYARASIIFTGDVFGSEQYVSTVTTIFQEARRHSTIQLENIGLSHVFPVHFADVVEEIVKVGLGTDKGKIFLAFQQDGMTELSLCHMLQRIDPLIRIDFAKTEKPSVPLPEGEYLFDARYNVARRLQDIYADVVVGNSKNEPTQAEAFFSPHALQKEKTVGKKRHKRWGLAMLVFFLLLLSPMFLSLVYAGLGTTMLYASLANIRSGNYQQAASFSETSHGLFSAALSVNIVVQKELQAVLLTHIGGSFTNALQTGSIYASLLADGGQAVAKFSLVAKGNSPSPQADFLGGIDAIKNALALVEYTNMPGVMYGFSFHTIVSELQPFSSMLDIGPQLFGFPQKKVYMVLFQNNMELRPGGGFIGSYALVTVNQGRVTGFSIHDVYDADGQLKGHIEPPYVIRRYIPQQHWYLRDSNFDVDFSQDAASAAFFLQQELGQKVDGVVGIDLTFVKDILAGIGPIYVPAYNQTVTAQNFFLLTESHAEKNSFAGSAQKKDFLTALFQAMQSKVTSAHGFSTQALLPILSATQSKDIVFGFSDPLIQDVFTINGLSDSLWDTRKTDTATVMDTTGINEANIGVNKANYFIARSSKQSMAIDAGGTVTGKLTITYKNDSKKNVWPGGPYKNYLRLILPLGAKLTSVAINGKIQSLVPAITDASIYEKKGFIPPQGLEVDSNTEEGKQLYGFVVTIPEQTTQAIEISYILLQKINVHLPTFVYSNTLIKQPGVDAYPYTFSLAVPNSFALLQKPNWIQGSGNTVSFATSLGEDTPFAVIFTQK